MSAATSAEVAEAVARHNVRNRKMTGVLTVSALLDELDRLHKVEEAARAYVAAGQTPEPPAELRCDRCGRSTADSDRDMAAPVVYFVRQGLCHPCSRGVTS